jgi:hypothetical protein
MRSDERRPPRGQFAGRYPGASYGLRPDRDTSPILEASHVHVRDASMGDGNSYIGTKSMRYWRE